MRRSRSKTPASGKLEKIADWARDVVEVHKSGSDPSWQIAHLEEALAELDK